MRRQVMLDGFAFFWQLCTLLKKHTKNGIVCRWTRARATKDMIAEIH